VTPSAARTAANVVLVSAGLAAAYVVLTRPPLRRLALRGLRLWLGVTVPAYVVSNVKQAWVESGHNSSQPSALSRQLSALG
jgi:hypothetical protein